MIRGRSAIVCIASVVAASLLGAAPARAATSCSLDGVNQILTVSMSAGGDLALLEESAGSIEVRNKAFNPVGCSGGSPTTVNTDTIVVNDGSGGSTTAEVDDPDSFNGTASEGAGNDSEIEIDVNLGGGGKDTLRLRAPSFDDARFVYGTGGINVSATSETTPDADVTPSGVERNEANGVFGDDLLSGAGGSGTGSAFPGRLTLEGSFGDDRLIGGSARDRLIGSFGADLIRGGADIDTAVYDYVCSSECNVDVDIGAGTGNDGAPLDESESTPGVFDTVKGDVENLIGGTGNDRLVGNGRGNKLVGGTGRDRLIGKGGNDRLKARDFVQDLRLNCGPGSGDRVRRDPFDPKPISC